jgi:Bacteriocin-protection, YdeI or OmpD-Associated
LPIAGCLLILPGLTEIKEQESRTVSFLNNLYLKKAFMALVLSQKLKIREKDSLLALNAPNGFKASLGSLPAGVKISTSGSGYTQIHWFVMSRAQMEKEWPGVLKLIKPEVTCWIYYPKGSSGIQTDLTRDKGWDLILKQDELQWISLISFDDTWSTFGCRLTTDKDKRKAEKPKERPIFDYIDAAKKIVRTPDDFDKALKKNKKASEFFKSLSFTNRKEYVEWIVTAKKEETRNERVHGSIERLEKGWKNPRNL